MVARSLQFFLEQQADVLCPLTHGRHETRAYAEHTQSQTVVTCGSENADNRAGSVWRVGVLIQSGQHKAEPARMLIGHEHTPGTFEFIGFLHWRNGEQCEIGRVMMRYIECCRDLGRPSFFPVEIVSYEN